MSISNDVIRFCDRHLGEFRIRNGQVVAQYCPFCKGGDHSDKETFAVGLYNGAFSCLRGGCGKTGSFRELCAYFGERYDESYEMPAMAQPKKVYEKPDPDELRPLTEKALTYFAGRHISEETLSAFKVSCDDKGNIVFPFYLDGVLTFIKYRKPEKHTKDSGPKEWSMRNGEAILFGMDNVSFHKPLFITEGEIDALSLYEAGITNVVSVPCGCNNLEFVTLCWDWLERFQQIVLFGDSDEPGLEMVSTLMKRLGEDRCMIAPQYPPLVVGGKDYGRPCKDANEILFAYGPEKLAEIANSCEPAPVKGVLDVSEIQIVDPTTQPRIFSRIPALDNAIGGFGEGGISILSGKRGSGKSSISGSWILNAVQQGTNCAAYSGELSASKFAEWLFSQACEQQYIGVKTDKRNGKQYTYIPDEVQERIKDWLSGHVYLYDNSCTFDDMPEDSIIKIFTLCARRYGCKLFLVDNMMTVTSGSEEEIKAQARFAAKLKAFAVKFKAHVLLVAHPRKTKQGEAIQNDDVAGSSAITNLADNVIIVEKPNLRIIKNRDFGVLDYIECSFNPANRRIYQTSVGDRTVYGWDHSNLTLPENQACALPEFAVQVGQPEGAGAI